MPKEEYEKRKKYYERLIKKQDKSIKSISNLRLVTFLVGALVTIFFYVTKNYFLCVGLFLAFLLIFIYLVREHNKVIESRKYSLSLHKINDDSIKRIDGNWKSFSDTGEEFLEEDHNYSKDLDIFGRGSLFQWINTTATFLGRRKLSSILKEPYDTVNEIYTRQEAIKELAEKLDWRQEFMADGIIASDNIQDTEDLFNWAKDRKNEYCNPLLSGILKVVPIITTAIIILPLLWRTMPLYLSPLAIIVNILILMKENNYRSRALSTVDKYKDSIKVYYKMIRCIEKEKFNSRYLKNIKSNLIDDKGHTASWQINKLVAISDMTSCRRSSYYFFMNILTLWDYQCMFALEKWKRDSGKSLEAWLNAIGEMEVISSMSIINYDNPEWTMPKIVEETDIISAKNMGHPLLTNARVRNDFKIEKPASILLITGSNMSGKSTLLRTVGINLILAYIGAPVCADEFTCSIMNVYTCMRVSDDLERNISSFYAELLRIKKIVEASKENKKIFFLLDEIFKGTNSMDRHTGAKVLINKLRKEGAVGLVSTHDLELGDLEKESSGRIKNYHFKEYYKDNKIYFDYKLRSGISTTRNALYLINMIGIDVENNFK